MTLTLKAKMSRGRATPTLRGHKSDPVVSRTLLGRFRMRLSCRPESLSCSHRSRWSRLQGDQRPREEQASDSQGLEGQKRPPSGWTLQERGLPVLSQVAQEQITENTNPRHSQSRQTKPGRRERPQETPSSPLSPCYSLPSSRDWLPSKLYTALIVCQPLF